MIKWCRSQTDIRRTTHSILSKECLPHNWESHKRVSDCYSTRAKDYDFALRTKVYSSRTTTKFKSTHVGPAFLLFKAMFWCPLNALFICTEIPAFPHPRTLIKIPGWQGFEGLDSWRMPAQKSVSAVCPDFSFLPLGEWFSHSR